MKEERANRFPELKIADTLDIITMTWRVLFQVLCLTSALLCGCESRPGISVTGAPGVSIPNVDDLAQKLDGSIGGTGIKMYVKETGRLIEVRRSPHTNPLSVVVRSFDPKAGLAYVDLAEYSEDRMPMLQVWRFNGKTWSDSIDPGIFVR